MNAGPKISRGNGRFTKRILTQIPLEPDTTEDEAVKWIEGYKEWCEIELRLMPFWAWSRRRYLRGELVYADVVADAIMGMGVRGFVERIVLLLQSDS